MPQHDSAPAVPAILQQAADLPVDPVRRLEGGDLFAPVLTVQQSLSEGAERQFGEGPLHA